MFNARQSLILHNVQCSNSFSFAVEPEADSFTHDTQDNHAPGPAPSSSEGGQPLPAIDFLLGDFSRRFERQSWRIRHEEERRRLKQKFEVSSGTLGRGRIIL